MSRRYEDILTGAIRDEMKARVVAAVVVAGAARLGDVARISRVQLNLVWELVRELEAAGLIMNDPFGHGSVFALPKAERAAPRRDALTPVGDSGDAA